MAKIKLVGTILDNDSAKIYSWYGFDAISAKAVEKAIRELGDEEELEIDLNSPGGYCSVGAEIYTMLRQASQSGHKVTVNVVGEACSAATVLMCGADEVNGSAVSVFMFHNASTAAMGKARDMRSAVECLEQTDEAIVNAYERKTGHSREELHDLIDAETWMSVNRAKEYGFVDNIMFEDGQDGEDPDNEEDNSLLLDMVRACAVSHGMIPEDKLNLMRNAMLSEIAKEKEPKEDVNAVSIDINKNPKGEKKKMTLNEIYEKHPELKDEVTALVEDAKKQSENTAENPENALQEAVAAERKRIQDIEAIAGSIPEDMVKDAKFDNPCDAKELAFKALTADNQKRQEYMANAIKDSDDSGAKDVKATPEGEGAEASDELAGYVNANHGKGVK